LSALDRFTQSARTTLTVAYQEAEQMKHAAIGSEHILLALIQDEGGIAGQVLADLGVEIDRAREIVLREMGLGSTGSRQPP